MWANGAITIAIWEDAKLNHGGEILNKNFQRTPGSEKRDSPLKFDEVAFGTETGDFAEEAADLDTKELDVILASAKELAHRARSGGSRSSRPTESTAEDTRPIKRRRLGNVNDESACKFLCLYHYCIV